MAEKHGSRRRNEKIISISLTLVLILGVHVQSKAATQTQNPDVASHSKVFGLAMGMPLAQLQNDLSFKKEGDLYVGAPPEPSDLFSKYGVIATNKSGLCDVIAMTPDSGTNAAGTQIKKKVDEIAKILEVKYGRPSQKIKTIQAGTDKENLEYWSLDLSKGDVSYGYIWNAGANGATLPNDLESITLMAFGVNSDTAHANLQYAFKNTGSCTADTRAEKATKL